MKNGGKMVTPKENERKFDFWDDLTLVNIMVGETPRRLISEQ